MLSEYLTAIQCAGTIPPQETGETFNSWFGKAHLEMHWWHAAHFPLWDRAAMLERSLPWYRRILPVARANAARQGYRGARWPKMVGPEGRDSPSGIGVFLIWQQPHPIYLAELVYRARPDRRVLERYRDLVFASAEFMASYPVVGPGEAAVRARPAAHPGAGEPSGAHHLQPHVRAGVLGVRTVDGAAMARAARSRARARVGSRAERTLRAPDARRAVRERRVRADDLHRRQPAARSPTLLGAYGFVASPRVDREAMRRTLRRVFETWQWDETWGWDYPLVAMTAARVGEPSLAIDALLMDTPKNRYHPNGHNYQRPGLTIYLPGTGAAQRHGDDGRWMGRCAAHERAGLPARPLDGARRAAPGIALTEDGDMSQEIGRREFIRRGTMAGVVATGLPSPRRVRRCCDRSTRHAAHRRDPSRRRARLPRAGRAASRQQGVLSLGVRCAEAGDVVQRHDSECGAPLAAARQAKADRTARRLSVEARAAQRGGARDDGPRHVHSREDRLRHAREPQRDRLLLLPKNAPRPLPAVVCVSGHGRGLPDILGIADDGSQRAQRNVGYAKEYALQCVEHGYATLAVEQLAFGTRRDDAARRAGAGTESCRPAACAALLLGQTMAGWRVWDAMRSIDYLGTRPEVDSTRVATLGASGGGTTSLLTAACDQRVKAAVVSAYFNTFRGSIVSISHCPDNYVPGMLQDMEMYDLSGLVAPRALFVESGRNDRIFPIAGYERAVAKAREIYRVYGAADRFGAERRRRARGAPRGRIRLPKACAVSRPQRGAA